MLQLKTSECLMDVCYWNRRGIFVNEEHLTKPSHLLAEPVLCLSEIAPLLNSTSLADHSCLSLAANQGLLLKLTLAFDDTQLSYQKLRRRTSGGLRGNVNINQYERGKLTGG